MQAGGESQGFVLRQTRAAYNSGMRKFALVLFLLLSGCIDSAPVSPIVIDGFFNDWPSQPGYMDPAGDAGPSGVDITGISVVHTDSELIINIDLRKVVNLQSEPALAMSLFTGNGPELEYDFGAREGRVDGLPVGHADIGLVTLPTVTSDRFEIALRTDAVVHGDALFPPGAPVTLSFFDPNRNGDTVAPIIYSWDRPAAAVEPLGMERPEGALRLVSYNVERDGVLDSRRTDHFGRILKALQPDVIAFQEINNRSASSVEARVEEWLGGDWFALKQADLVTLARYPFVEGWTDTFRPLDERVYAQMIEVEGRRLLIFNAHLFCCDENKGRQEQADGFAAFLRDMAPEGVPFVLIGDLNLVGDAAQLHTLLTGDIVDEQVYGVDSAPDWDGTSLADLVPRHLNSAHTYTWFSAGSDFAPGRLDFAIYTDSLLEAAGFVFDPSELSANMLAGLGVLADDAVEASDHLPLVVDLFFKP